MVGKGRGVVLVSRGQGLGAPGHAVFDSLAGDVSEVLRVALLDLCLPY